MDTTVSDPLVGQVVDDRYRVVSKLARGGMATVYEAVDLRLERTVALKVMHGALAEDADFVARFVREARSAARLSHPNVVAVYDQGTDGKLVYLVMEYVPSLNLREVLRERGQLTVQESFDVIEPVLAALTAAHSAGIVHRDVKPENVLLAQDGRILVADFGLARAVSNATSASTQGVLIGTVAYLAPEQVERGVADPRSDVYAAGIVLFEMLTGAPPFAGETPLSVAYQHVNGVVPAPSESVDGLPPQVDGLLSAATARDPDARYSDAGRFLEALRATRQRIGLPVWSAVAATSPHSLSDTIVVPRAAGEQRSQPTAVVERAAVPGAVAASAASSAATADPPGDEPQEQTPRKQRRRRRIRGLIVVLVVLAIAAGIGVYAFNKGSVTYATTPAVATLTRDAAGAKIRDVGLTPVAGPQLFSETVAKGSVIRTVPGPNEKLESGTNVVMTISKGPERYAVPKLKGLSEVDAKKAITGASLSVGPVTKAFSESVDEGDVVSFSPAAGKQLKKASVVEMVVSKGPKPISVPKVVGSTLASATAKLQGLGLKVTNTEALSNTVPKGTVMSQSPNNGASVPRGTTVALVVSKGPPPVTVPNVIGLTVAAARTKLNNAGLQVKGDYLLPFGIPIDNVRRQSIGAGVTVPRGTLVTIGYV